MVASLQKHPQWSSPSMYRLMSQNWSVWPGKCDGSDAVRLLRPGKGIAAFTLVSPSDRSAGSQSPGPDDAEAVLWRGPHGERSRPPTKCHGQLANHVMSHTESEFSSSLQSTTDPASTGLWSRETFWARAAQPSHF